MQEILPIQIKGHLIITDDLGNVLVDKDNAVHPRNMARVIARALAREDNYFIHRIALGNGGTDVDAALNITFNTPNDGQPPDTRTWDSQLYNETYSEIVDDSNPNIGTGPGANPADDPPTVEHVSGPGVFSSEIGILSQVSVRATLNRDEPAGQTPSSTFDPNPNAEYVFDEVALFTSGAEPVARAGFQNVEVGVPSSVTSESDTTLSPSTTYNFLISVDGGPINNIEFTTPAAGSGNGTDAPINAITYGDFCQALNTNDPDWFISNSLPGNSIVEITDLTGNYPTIIGAQTNGFLRFTSGSVGSASVVELAVGSPAASVFGSTGFNSPAGSTIFASVNGTDAGVQNNPVSPDLEAERMLTHIVFAPVTKAADRILNIKYTLTIAVARTI